MLRRIQAKNFRSLRDVNVNVALEEPIHILVGPNGSGKSALLEVVRFFRDSMTVGLEAAVKRRTGNFQDLVWMRPKDQMKDLYVLTADQDMPIMAVCLSGVPEASS